MRKIMSILAAVSVVLTVAPVQASTVQAKLPGAELRGQATFRYVGFPIYEARLFTPSGARLDWSRDIGLELRYLRNVSEGDLVDNTLRELQRLGAAAPSRAQLERCYRDVGKGDRYVAVSRGPDEIGLWYNDRRMCTLSHPGIRAGFMGIFLSERSRSPAFSRQLRQD